VLTPAPEHTTIERIPFEILERITLRSSVVVPVLNSNYSGSGNGRVTVSGQPRQKKRERERERERLHLNKQSRHGRSSL
jgi:hypothetical protein